MSHLRSILLVTMLVLAAVPGGAVAASTDDCAFPFTATDSTDTDVTVTEEPERVVVLAGSAAQTMWEIGGEEQVVGLPVAYSGYLDGASDRTDIMAEDGFTVDVETVIDLDPDLVLAPSVISTETVTKLRNAGLTVYRFGPSATIDDVRSKTLLTGQLTGNCEGAHETVEWMDQELQTVETALDGVDRPGVLLPLGGGYTAGAGTFLDDVITTGGGENIAARANISFYGPISNEVILEQDPEWIIVQDSVGYPDNPVLNETTAGKNGNVLVVDADLLSQPAPRVVEVVVTLAKTMHPDAYAEADATPTPTPSPTPTDSPEPTVATSENDDMESTTTSTTQTTPGFGVVPALIALLAVTLLARRR